MLAALAAALSLPGCGAFFIARRVVKAIDEPAKPEAQVDKALERYREAVLHADTDRIAAMFTADAKVWHDQAAPVVGREAIRAFLKTFEGFRVEAYELDASSTRLEGDTATQKGSYHQKALTPQGRTMEVKGRFEARWSRQGGDWRLSRMHTEAS
jgi:uncharacterized protein (TIGR02246 family)